MRTVETPNATRTPETPKTAKSACLGASHVFASLKRLAFAPLGAALRAAGFAVACLRGFASLARLALHSLCSAGETSALAVLERSGGWGRRKASSLRFSSPALPAWLSAHVA